MSRYVVDASVAVKWLVPEVHSEAAFRLHHPEHELLAPDLLPTEVGNVLWRMIRRGELSREAGHEGLRLLLALPLNLFASAAIVEFALDIANDTGRTVYDSLYLALATVEQCQMVTADQRLHNAISGGPLDAHILWVEEFPITDV